MKYYSTVLNKLFDSEADLHKAEAAEEEKAKIAKEKAEREKLEKERAEAIKAKERQKIEKMIKETTTAIDEYIKKYNDYHFLFTPYSASLWDVLAELLK